AEARSGFHDLMVHEKAIGTEYEIKFCCFRTSGDIDVKVRAECPFDVAVRMPPPVATQPGRCQRHTNVKFPLRTHSRLPLMHIKSCVDHRCDRRVGGFTGYLERALDTDAECAWRGYTCLDATNAAVLLQIGWSALVEDILHIAIKLQRFMEIIAHSRVGNRIGVHDIDRCIGKV